MAVAPMLTPVPIFIDHHAAARESFASTEQRCSRGTAKLSVVHGKSSISSAHGSPIISK